jgi:hypothetical protein
MFYLNDAQRQSLLLLPESGLGYQLVEIATMARSRVVGVAYNAELVFEPDEGNQALLFKSFSKGIPVQVNGAPVREVGLLPRDSAAFRALQVGEPRATYATKGLAAAAAPVVGALPGEVFVRFSACARDHRVRPDGSLAPGSFATTADDAARVRAAKETLGRYALPHPGPTGYFFTIRPVPATLVQYGVAQPAHGRPGGGVEVIFTEGTTLRTVTGPERLEPGTGSRAPRG